MNAKEERLDDERRRKSLVILLLVCFMSYFLVWSVGRIESYGALVPVAGGADVFEITCVCCNSNDGSGNSGGYNNGSLNDEVNNGNGGGNHDKNDSGDKANDGSDNDADHTSSLIVYDDYKIWDNKELRIFANSIYGGVNMIAPGSFSSYDFVIKNNNDFDIVADVIFKEANEEGVNMLYKLRHDGGYLVGDYDTYEEIGGVKMEDIRLPAHGYEAYSLDWKWVDSDNDTKIGFDARTVYKLSITVATK